VPWSLVSCWVVCSNPQGGLEGKNKFERIKIIRRKIMNNDIFEGKWKQMRGQAKVWWGKLTDDDLEKVAGKKDKLIGLLQEKYGYTKLQAEEEYKKKTNSLNIK